MLRAGTHSPGHGTDPAALDGPVLVASAGVSGAGALRVAQLLAARAGARPTVVSVLDPQPLFVTPPEMGPPPPDFDAVRRDAWHRTVARQVREVLGSEDAAPIEVVIGEPGHALADEARRCGAAVVVVGRGRHDAAARLLREETELRILRRVHCPVLAVPESRTTLPRSALAAVDFSPLSVAAAQAALDVVARPGTLQLVHVWAPLDADDAWSREHDARYAASLDGHFARAVSALRVPPDVRVTTVALEGDAGARATVEVLLAHAAAAGADLIAVGRQSHGVLERLIVGSVATGVIRGAECAVLAAPMPSPAIAERLARHMRGSFEAHTPEEWAVSLDHFVRRNAGRRTRLERYGTDLGIHAQQSGYPLLGAAYDAHDRRIELMFGTEGARAHLTHSIADPTTVAVVGDDARGDVALRIDHAAGWTLLTFVASADASG